MGIQTPNPFGLQPVDYAARGMRAAHLKGRDKILASIEKRMNEAKEAVVNSNEQTGSINQLSHQK